jgi:hypothetical protein
MAVTKTEEQLREEILADLRDLGLFDDAGQLKAVGDLREKEKEEAIIGLMEQLSLYLSEPKADFTPNYESVAVKLSLDRSIEEAHEPNLPSPSA